MAATRDQLLADQRITGRRSARRSAHRRRLARRPVRRRARRAIRGDRPGRRRRLRAGRAEPQERPRPAARPRRARRHRRGRRAPLVPDLGQRPEARPRRSHRARGGVAGRRRPRHRHLAARLPPPRGRPGAHHPTRPGVARPLAEAGQALAGRAGRLGAAAPREAGEVAFLLEPDLKEGRGGLRDVHALRWAQAARSVLLEGDEHPRDPLRQVLLSVRVELHRRTGRPGDRLLLEEQDAVAAALGYDDADALMRAVATAARAIAWRSDETWRRVESTSGGPHRAVGGPRAVGRPRAGAARRRRWRVTHDADVTDPVLPLRAAATAASHGTTIDRSSLERSPRCRRCPTPGPTRPAIASSSCCWPGAGHPVIETARPPRPVGRASCPSGRPVHCKPQRNAYHRFTVDRHLLEAAANAAGLTDPGRPPRPARRRRAAPRHRQGPSGRPHRGRHRASSRRWHPAWGSRCRRRPSWWQMVRHHLLLPDVATRRDLADEGTLRPSPTPSARCGSLRLLDALTEADSLATGPAAWGEWKAGLVRELVARSAHLLAGGRLAEILPARLPLRGRAGPSWHRGTSHRVDGRGAHRGRRRRARSVQPGGGRRSPSTGWPCWRRRHWSDDGRAIAQFRVGRRSHDPYRMGPHPPTSRARSTGAGHRGRASPSGPARSVASARAAKAVPDTRVSSTTRSPTPPPWSRCTPPTGWASCTGSPRAGRARSRHPQRPGPDAGPRGRRLLLPPRRQRPEAHDDPDQLARLEAAITDALTGDRGRR
jgi:hypothetical protein